ncbi:MAG: tripartite tricarboxylate transporter TctB family protein [Giesbergeria sp.]
MNRLKALVPYVVVLLISGYLFYRSTQFDFDAPRGRIGPDVWPKVILGLAMLTCAYEILKKLLFSGGREAHGLLQSIAEDIPEVQAPADDAPPSLAQPRTFPRLLISGMAMTVAYAALVDKLGFFICTVLFLAGFTWVGRYRRLGVTVIVSFIGGLVFTFVFMKLVYVSLPLGVGPFEQVSVQLMQIMGIR